MKPLSVLIVDDDAMMRISLKSLIAWQEHGYVFAMSTLDSIDDSLKNIARECGIDKQLSFHLARHTYATTICLSNGVSLETLSKMLGHKNITTTQIYAKVTPPMIDREVTMLREKLATKFSV